MRNAARPERLRKTVVQITVRLTAVEDRALAGLLERGAFPSVTDAIRTLIRDRAAADAAAVE
jgi:Arc/MetJ-type ribon-helix-helix transcriptional regulator